MSIRNKLILVFTLLVLLIVAAMAGIGYVSIKDIYLDQIAEQNNRLSRLMGSTLSPQYLDFLGSNGGSSQAADYYRKQLQESSAQLGLSNAFLFNRELETLLQTNAEQPVAENDDRLLLNRTEITRLAPGQATTSLPFRDARGEWYLWGFYRIDADYWLGIQEHAREFQRVEELGQTFLLIGMIGMLLTGLAGWFLAATIAKPIDRLVRFSGALGQRDFKAALPEGLSGELATLATAMDRMRQDLSEHHREKERILAQVAHEIRNPLGGMELLSGLVREDLIREGQSTSYIDKVLNEISGLKELIRAYLNYSKPMIARPEKLIPAEDIRELAILLEPKLQDKAATLSFEDAQDPVWFDRSHFKQVLMNLLSNSLEAVDTGGKISVETAQQPDKTLVMISDNGPGIADEHIDTIFEPFYTTRAEGSGLGLAICKKLCNENDAEIAVERDYSPGGKFVLSIPTRN